MPELAAHLERVAKELSEQLVLNIVLLYNGNHPGAEIIKEANKVVAAALAACAREARLDEAKWWADGMHAKGGGEICKFCERIESLERAVGEKGQ